MIECASCRTLNPDAARSCLACGRPLGSVRAATEAVTDRPVRCPEGHPVDPEWPSCPYCDRSRERANESRPPSRPSDPTRLDFGMTTPLPGSPPPAGEPSAGAPSNRTSRLVAVLAAPDLGAGAVFPVRAGKTLIGTDRRSDVAIAGDARVSAEHAALLYRDGVFQLTDRLSTNGTFINGLEVPANGTVALRDRDQLLVGDTRLVLMIIDPARGVAPAAP